MLYLEHFNSQRCSCLALKLNMIVYLRHVHFTRIFFVMINCDVNSRNFFWQMDIPRAPGLGLVLDQVRKTY